MYNPIGSKEGVEQDIGRHVERISKNGQTQPDDNQILASWLTRLDDEDPKPTAEVKFREPPETKWVVIPDQHAIKRGLEAVKAIANSDYPLREEYERQTFDANKETLKKLAAGHSDEATIVAFLDEVTAPAKMPPEDFFYFRLGEYCVSQCY